MRPNAQHIADLVWWETSFFLYNDGIICLKWVNLGLRQEEDLCFSRVVMSGCVQSSGYEVL